MRDTESIARRIATDRVRKKEYLYSPDVLAMEKELTEALGTRVAIEGKENGGKLAIDFMNEDDLRAIFNRIAARLSSPPNLASGSPSASPEPAAFPLNGAHSADSVSAQSLDDRPQQEIEKDENTFDPNSFSI